MGKQYRGDDGLVSLIPWVVAGFLVIMPMSTLGVLGVPISLVLLAACVFARHWWIKFNEKPPPPPPPTSYGRPAPRQPRPVLDDGEAYEAWVRDGRPYWGEVPAISDVAVRLAVMREMERREGHGT